MKSTLMCTLLFIDNILFAHLVLVPERFKFFGQSIRTCQPQITRNKVKGSKITIFVGQSYQILVGSIWGILARM